MAAFVATLPMPQPDYKIYRMLPNGTSVWMENANNLQAARVRATELSLQSSERVTVYDLRNPARAVFEMKR
jgi:spore coat polysaccharide biosynthesis protein SpsF (cytidylyltransferase family)